MNIYIKSYFFYVSCVILVLRILRIELDKKYFLNCVRIGGASAGQLQQQSQQNRELNAQYGPGPSLRPQSNKYIRIYFSL